MKKTIRYGLAKNGKSLLHYFMPDYGKKESWYHIHENELTTNEKLIRDSLIKEKEKERELALKGVITGVNHSCLSNFSKKWIRTFIKKYIRELKNG